MRRLFTLPAQFQMLSFTLVLLWLLCLGSSVVHGKELPVAGGTTLYTQAIATYTSIDNLEPQQTTSAVVSVKVASVEAAQFSMQARADITSGTTAQVSLALQNTGNVDTEIRLRAELLGGGNFSLGHIQIVEDVDGIGRIRGGQSPELPDRMRLYRRGENRVFIVTGTVPHDASGSVQVALIASSAAHGELVKEVVTLHATTAGNVIALKTAKLKDPAVALRGQKIAPRIHYKIRAGNVGNQPAYGIKVGDVVDGGHTLMVDGAVMQGVVLIREKIPAGTIYVPGMANVGVGLSTAQILYRSAADGLYQYRTTPPTNPAHVIEIAMAVKAKMYRGDWFTFQYDVEVNNVSRREILSEPTDVWFRDTATAALTHTQDMRVNKIDISPDASPDLAINMRQDAPFMAEKSQGSYTITVRNDGALDSHGAIRVVAELPNGVRMTSAQGNGWECTASEQTVRCNTTQIIYQHRDAEALKLDVATNVVLPAGVYDALFPHNARVEGGGEAADLQANNNVTGQTRIMSGAILAGTVWQDDNQNGRLDSNEMPLKDWRVQLLSMDVQHTVLREVLADQQGQFRLTGIAPGGPYALRTLSPTGGIKSLPIMGNAHSVSTKEKIDVTPLPQLGAVQIAPLEGGQQYAGFDMPVLHTGVVYDVATQSPIQGAQVRLVADAPGFDPSLHLVGGKTAQIATSDTEGKYYLQLTADAPLGTYHYEVMADGYKGGVSSLYPPVATPLSLPVGSNGYLVSNSATQPESPADALYYLAFKRDAGSQRIVNNHIPLQRDQALSYALVLKQEADRKNVELLDFVNYTLTLSHALPTNLRGFVIDYDLPPGFNIVAGTTRLNINNAQQLAGPQLDPQHDSAAQSRRVHFAFPDALIPVGQSATLRFRVRVGSTAKERTRAISKANANSGIYRSNEAVASVKVSGGVMSDDAFVAGKVFVDLNANGLQDAADPAEVGVPGVRIYLEDGSFAETDADGKYSLYGLKPLTHVLKLDPISLPSGMHPVITSNRNAGQAGSIFLDVKNGELARADFALACGGHLCDQQIATEIARRQALSNNREIDTALKRPVDYENRERSSIDVRALAASGVIDAAGNVSAAAARQDAPASGKADTAAAANIVAEEVAQATPLYNGDALKQKQFEELLQKQDGKLGFIGLRDGDQLASKQASIRVAGKTGHDFILRVNAKVIEDSRVGARSAIEERHIAAWEYISVNFQEGLNLLELQQAGAEPVHITVLVAGDVRSIKLDAPAQASADGKSMIPVTVRLLDASGLTVPRNAVVTVVSNAGVWQLTDLDGATEGVQAMLKNGVATFQLQAPSQAASGVLRVAVDGVEAEHKLAFLPELRPMIATGIVEGVLNLRKGSIEGTRSGQNGFERELRQFSRQTDDGRLSAAARAAFFLKGKVKGEYLLTAAYDSEKEVRDRLFRDIEPDKYYPIYGDSSVRGFDAQTSGKMYIRIDKQQSYLLYGDLPAESTQGVRQLTQYNRSLNGAKYHLEKGPIKGNVFASHDSLTQRQTEFVANGTSGPFRVFDADYIENSEQVEIISRNETQSAANADRQTLTRNVDYEVELESGMLLFTSPQPSLDANGHQRIVRVTYEADGEGKSSWLVGGDVAMAVTDAVTLGVVAVEDKNPADPRIVRGLTAEVALGANTTLGAELAQTTTLEKGHGNGARLELKHEGERLKAKAAIARTDRDFDNLSASVSGGYDDSRANLEYQRDDGSVIKAEAIRTKDHRSDGGVSDITADLSGAMISVEKQLPGAIKLSAGVRVVRGSEATTEEGSRDVNLNTIRGRIEAPLPGIAAATVFTDVEQDVMDFSKRRLTLGGDYQLFNAGRLYGSWEALSTLGNFYDLGSGTRNYDKVLGLESAYSKLGKTFSEYRQGGDITGRDAQAAFGVRDGWEVVDGVHVAAGFERTKTLGGQVGNESSALTGSLDYLPNTRLRASTTLELRKGSREDSVLSTMGVAAKLNADWTALAKSATYYERNHGEAEGSSVRSRQRLGLAYRPTHDNTLNALAYFEHRLSTGRLNGEESDRSNTDLLSAHANLMLTPHSVLSARYAFKRKTEDGAGIRSQIVGHLLSSRLTWDITDKWDVGVGASIMFDGITSKTALGMELGYLVGDGLWVSLVYNIFGFNDKEFAEMAQITPGAYIRLRYKFDENSF